jgi:hypothetical protein
MQSGAVTNNVAFVEYDLALVNSGHGPHLVVEELCPRCLTFLVNRTRSPIESVIFSRSNTLNFRASSSGNCFSTKAICA